jgi:hypothetical protein
MASATPLKAPNYENLSAQFDTPLSRKPGTFPADLNAEVTPGGAHRFARTHFPLSWQSSFAQNALMVHETPRCLLLPRFITLVQSSRNVTAISLPCEPRTDEPLYFTDGFLSGKARLLQHALPN